MSFYVYIIKSLADQSYYKGFTENPIIRLERHNNGESEYTKNKLPWDLVYLECFEQKKDALIREKRLKKYSHQQIEQLIISGRNKLSGFVAPNTGDLNGALSSPT
ncbi:MAG: GIY-YIG nuclease family protein [Bacteroidetes bacterium]|nr:GIY-YIG nuclease family protein [Bacteroidota bacterium]